MTCHRNQKNPSSQHSSSQAASQLLREMKGPGGTAHNPTKRVGFEGLSEGKGMESAMTQPAEVTINAIQQTGDGAG